MSHVQKVTATLKRQGGRRGELVAGGDVDHLALLRYGTDIHAVRVDRNADDFIAGKHEGISGFRIAGFSAAMAPAFPARSIPRMKSAF